MQFTPAAHSLIASSAERRRRAGSPNESGGTLLLSQGDGQGVICHSLVAPVCCDSQQNHSARLEGARIPPCVFWQCRRSLAARRWSATRARGQSCGPEVIDACRPSSGRGATAPSVLSRSEEHTSE